VANGVAKKVAPFRLVAAPGTNQAVVAVDVDNVVAPWTKVVAVQNLTTQPPLQHGSVQGWLDLVFAEVRWLSA
jgi:hypothetical protein